MVGSGCSGLSTLALHIVLVELALSGPSLVHTHVVVVALVIQALALVVVELGLLTIVTENGAKYNRLINLVKIALLEQIS